MSLKRKILIGLKITMRTTIHNFLFILQIPLCPNKANIVLTKGQHAVLRSKINAKEFVYALMSMLWTREVLSTHSITGKASNAFKGRDAKPPLDQEKVKNLCGK